MDRFCGTEGRSGCVEKIPKGETIVENSPRSSREKYTPRERCNTEGRGEWTQELITRGYSTSVFTRGLIGVIANNAEDRGEQLCMRRLVCCAYRERVHIL